MAVLSYEELMAKAQGIIGERDDDEVLSFLEDMKDTVSASNTDTNNENWKKKYEENDAKWRKTYRDTFFGTPVPPTEPEPPVDDPPGGPTTYEDLFKEE